MSRSHNAPLRFYPNEYPSEGEKVWVRVLEVNDTSATVQLLEYANHEGMIPYTEFTRLRIRSVGKIIKAGRMEAVQVLRVDTEKKYIDLSKKQVTPTEAKKCEEKFLKARDVHSIICHAADEVKMSRSEVMELVAYPLYRKHGCAWTCLKEALSGGDNALDELNMPKNLKDAILATASHRLREQPVRLRVDFEMTCFAADGVNGIREALRIGQQFGNDLQPAIALTASIVAPPAYALRTLTEHRDEGMRRMMEAVAAMQACVTAKGGNLRVTEAVRVIGDDITDKKDDKNAKGSSSSDEEDEEGEEAQ